MTMTIAYTSTTVEQPGRLFNRAPCSIDPFFTDHHQHRRRALQQVSSYHDLDDIPTMPAMPDTKARGGVGMHNSPQSVTDVKRFDVAAYQDDNGGVDIDLCLSESSDCEDDYFLLLEDEDEAEAEPQQEQEQRCHPEPCLHQFSRPSPSFLAPILEERRVAFAAQHVVLKVDDGFDSCAIDQRFVHQVLDAVQVWFIPHHTIYDEKQRASMWYSKAEMAAMRERAIEAKKSRKKRLNDNSSLQMLSVQQQLDTCSLFVSPFDIGATVPAINPNRPEGHSSSSKDDEYELSSSERRARYEMMVDTVLLEQYEQRRMCLRVYGRVEQGFSGILDPDRLSRVYGMAGDTTRSQERAVTKARKAALLEEDKHKGTDIGGSNQEPSSAVATTVSGSSSRQQQQQHNKIPSKQLKRTPSFNSSAIEVETSHCLDSVVGSVFRVLLSPFLEIRKGDLFLGIGEEMSITI